MTEAETRAARWLEAWDSQGIHRTGTPAIAPAPTGWRPKPARSAPTVAIEEFAFDRLDPAAAYLEIARRADRRRAGVRCAADRRRRDRRPAWAEIAVAELSPRAVYSGEFERLRRDGGHRGSSRRLRRRRAGPGLHQCRAVPHALRHTGDPCFERDPRPRAGRGAAGAPWRGSSSHSRRTPARAPQRRRRSDRRRAEQAAARRDDAAQLVVAIDRRARRRHRLLARKPAGAAGRAAGARRRLHRQYRSRTRPSRPRRFCRPPSRLGSAEAAARPGCITAPISAPPAACCRWSRTRTICAPRSRRTRRRRPAARRYAVAEPVPSGETRDIHHAGGRYLTLVGTNRLFHLPQDRWPHAVDVAAVTRIAEATAQMVAVLAG